jgi:hypothetical protein
MRKRTRILLAAVSVLAAVSLVVVLARDREPSHQGHPLSYWVDQYGAQHGVGEPDPEPEQAIFRLGHQRAALPAQVDTARAEAKAS